MNMQQSFAPARAVAQHCAELTDRGPRPEDRAEFLAMWRRDVAQFIEADIAPLFLGEKLEATLGEPEWLQGSGVFSKIGPIAVNCLLRCGSEKQTVLLSLDFATALALTDRSFGGSGALSEVAQSPLPSSAALLVERIAQVIAQAVVRASEGGEMASGDVMVRSESAVRLNPFGAMEGCVALSLTLGPKSNPQWSLLIAMRADQLDVMLPGLGAPSTAGKQGIGPADPHAAPYAKIPMPLDAILAEVELSLDQLKSLSVGDEIPLPTPRELPLRINARGFATGSLGTLDDKMALRITRINPEGLNL